MPRSSFTIKHNNDFKTTESIIANILVSSGFKEKDYNGERVWKKGTGLMTAMQYIKIEYSENTVDIQAWVQAGMGNVGGKEMDLKGFVAAVPKRALMKVVQNIQNALI